MLSAMVSPQPGQSQKLSSITQPAVQYGFALSTPFVTLRV